MKHNCRLAGKNGTNLFYQTHVAHKANQKNKLLEKICQLFFIFYIHILGPISKIREVREGEKDYSKRLDPYDVRRKAYFT